MHDEWRDNRGTSNPRTAAWRAFIKFPSENTQWKRDVVKLGAVLLTVGAIVAKTASPVIGVPIALAVPFGFVCKRAWDARAAAVQTHRRVRGNQTDLEGQQTMPHQGQTQGQARAPAETPLVQQPPPAVLSPQRELRPSSPSPTQSLADARAVSSRGQLQHPLELPEGRTGALTAQVALETERTSRPR